MDKRDLIIKRQKRIIAILWILFCIVIALPTVIKEINFRLYFDKDVNECLKQGKTYRQNYFGCVECRENYFKVK